MHYLVLVSFHTAHLQFISNAFMDEEASCEDMSRRGKGELALQEILLQL